MDLLTDPVEVARKAQVEAAEEEIQRGMYVFIKLGNSLIAKKNNNVMFHLSIVREEQERRLKELEAHIKAQEVFSFSTIIIIIVKIILLFSRIKRNNWLKSVMIVKNCSF